MKKGIKIQETKIEKGVVTVVDTEGGLVKVSRTQRNLLTAYKKNPDYVVDIITAFGRENVLADDYRVKKDGAIVFQLGRL